MKRILVVIIILTLIDQSFLQAQDKLNFPEVDKKTYAYYMSNDWKELVKIGKLSEKAGIDFYYLQVRMGIAYYNLKKYRLAIPYLEKSLENNTDNDFVKEYLYYAYLFSGREQDALKLSATISDDFKKTAGIKTPKGISSVGFDLKFDSFDDYKINTLSTDTLIQSNQTALNYFSVNSEFVFKNKTNLYLDVSLLNSSADLHSLNSSNIPILGVQNIMQSQLHLKYLANIGKGLNLVLASNFLHINIKREIESTVLESGSSSGYGYGGGTGSTTSSIKTNSSSINELVGYAAIYKDFSLFKIGLSSSISGLYDGMQIQPGVNLTFYPLGNTNLYTFSRYDFQIENYESSTYRTSVFKQAIGAKLFGVYLEPSVTFGEIRNFIEGDGLIVQNAQDIIQERYQILAYTWLLKGKLKLYLMYQNAQKQNYYSVNDIIGTTNYNHQSITGGIKWNF